MIFSLLSTVQVDVDVVVPHTATTAAIRVFTNLQDRDEYWGFSDVRITAVSVESEVDVAPSPPNSYTVISSVPTDLAGWSGECGRWTPCNDGLSAATSYTCNDNTMLGGFNVFGADAFAEKTFDVSDAHTHLRVQLRFFKIDRWDNEYGFVSVDGVHAWSQMFRNYDGER